MDKDYLEIVSRNILSDIKDKLRINGVILEEKQEKLTDEKMIEIIKSVVENDYKFMHKKEDEFEKDEKNKKLNSYVMQSLIQYYMAIYNDNLDLLHKLLDNDFDWNCENNYKMNLFVLDKRISSKFSEEEILNLSEEDIKVYKCIFGYRLDVGDHYTIVSNAIQKVKEIKKVNPGFNCALNALAYSILTKDQIMSLSKDAVDEINNRCAAYNFYKTEYNLTKNYIKRGIKFAKFKDGIKNKVKKKSRN